MRGSRDVELMKRPELWPLRRVLPLRHGREMDKSMPQLPRTAVLIVCPHGDLCLAEDANMLALPRDVRRWKVVTPEEVASRGWRVD